MRLIISGILIASAALVAPAPASADESQAPVPEVEVEALDVPEVDDGPRLRSATETPESLSEKQPDHDEDAEGHDAEGHDHEGHDHEPVEGELLAELDPQRTSSFAMIGVTWDPGPASEELAVDARLRVDGEWGEWQSLHIEPPVEDDVEAGRPGTEPLWVDEADGVAVRVVGPEQERPEGVEVLTIDPGEPTADEAAPSSTTAADSAEASEALAPVTDPTAVTSAATGPTFVGRPAIVSRAAWGARNVTSCDSPRYGPTTRGVVLHHTAGSNGYTRAQAASVVRATQAYHMDGRAWCDIGYNVLVDRFGQIFEGRAGGLDRPVRAAHAGNATVNSRTMGISMMGTFTSTEPSAAMKDAVVRTVGWRVAAFYMSPKGTYKVGGVTLHRISAHRNVVSTACPGQAAYAWLTRSGGLRDLVEDYIGNHQSKARDMARSIGYARTGPVTVGETGGSSYRKVQTTTEDIYHRDAVGTFNVNGHTRSEYDRVGSQKGSLRWPRSRRVQTGVSGVSVQRFDEGAIYRVTTGVNGAFALWGDIAATYEQRGGPGGALGAPRSSIRNNSSGSSQAEFVNGQIKRTLSGIMIVTMR